MKKKKLSNTHLTPHKRQCTNHLNEKKRNKTKLSLPGYLSSVL